MIRLGRPEDADAVLQLVQDAYGHYVARMGKPPGPMLDDYARRISDGQAWVLDEGGQLAGILVLEDLPDGALLLDNVAVSPSAQGKGHGRVLVAFAKSEARRRGHGEVRLYTHVLMTENGVVRNRVTREAGLVLSEGMMAPSGFRRWCKHGPRCGRGSGTAQRRP